MEELQGIVSLLEEKKYMKETEQITLDCLVFAHFHALVHCDRDNLTGISAGAHLLKPIFDIRRIMDEWYMDTSDVDLYIKTRLEALESSVVQKKYCYSFSQTPKAPPFAKSNIHSALKSVQTKDDSRPTKRSKA